MILRLYIIWEKVRRTIERHVHALNSKICFVCFLLKSDFFLNSTGENFLKIIKEFSRLTWATTPDSYSTTSRSNYESSRLLCALIDAYLEVNSEVTLNQIVRVLKTEIIERGKHGRKQL